jgi:peptidyl-prolyl cis-trans isomerase A (cyclophilin A)
VTFAMAGPGSRTTQVFINLWDNPRLDGMGFAPFGKLRDMKAAEKIHVGYGEGAPTGRGPDQTRLMDEGEAYLAAFPKLTRIKRARLIAP